MPLQAFAQALGLPSPVIRASKPHWLIAETCNFKGITGLLVYRSPVVRDTDEEYAVVANLLGRVNPELIYRGVLRDKRMMFGQGEVLVYLLHTTVDHREPTDPGVRIVVDMIRNWGDPVPNEVLCAEINRRLAKRGIVPSRPNCPTS